MTSRTRKKPERRPSPLTREQIIEAAIGLLDTAGESGLTFRALSERLATGPGAIYWHVAGKGELLVAATDHVVVAALSEVAGAEPTGRIHDVALGLFDAIERHPWLAPQLTAQISHNPAGSVTTCIFEAIGRQVYALDVPASSWFTATSALMHYILGAAGQNAANLALVRSLGPDTDRDAYMDSVTAIWKQLSPQEFPFARAVADQGLDHDDRAQFLAGIDLIAAGLTARRTD
ncbi:TetR/AcrR family transcriptional regulator [Streptomyces griseoruber]|uniref:TetR family transcriptional regulator n=1 Tax=Streptomyces griseoruber TaxID=1943 RepID=A0A124I0T9_9ACTN|nr:TetR family transcriptional regulator [Streptomyces griseoruber]KUN75206.1 TetR family transcriptional regulator [Streptomyces griseoruber]